MGEPITSEIIRAARMLVRWDQKALAETAGVSHVTVRRLEAKPGALVAKRPTIAKLRSALEAAGVIFVDENGEGPGVRLKKKTRPSEPIYIDASRTAYLEHGAKSERYPTLQEAVTAFQKLPPKRKEVATITSVGRVYSASEIERFRYRDGA